MSDSDSDNSVFEFDFDTDISEFSGFSASDSDSSDSEVEDAPDLQWQDELTPPMIEPFREMPGPNLEDFDYDSSPLGYFWKIFPMQLLAQIVTWTNGYARWTLRQPGAQADPAWYDVSFMEMRAFLAINILMGINQLPRLDMYWSSNRLIGNAAVSSIMPCNRFRKILQYFHVSDKEAEPPRNSPNYRLCKVQPVIHVLSDTFRTSYTLSREVSVDEAMIPFSGRLAYRQYMPAKPVKRGIKVWALCDARNGYMSKFDIYLGRQNNTTEHGLGYNVVTKLTDFLQGTWRMVYFDNFFTGIKLMKDLLARGLYACGTVRACRKGFLPSLKKPDNVKNRGDYKVLQLGTTNLVATTWKDKKLVHHLSTHSDPTAIMDARRRCGPNILNLRQPQTVHQYNQFMGGVDLHDQLRMNYDVGRNGKKAWRYIFWFCLNAAIVNAFVLYQMASTRTNTKKRFDHLAFRLELIEELIGGFTKRKKSPSPEPIETVREVDPQNVQGHPSISYQEKSGDASIIPGS